MASSTPSNELEAMRQRLRNFKVKVQKMLGMKISDREVLELYRKYGSSSDGKDYDDTTSRDVAKIRTAVDNAYEKGKMYDASIDCSNFTLEMLFDAMNHQIMARSGSSLGDNRVKTAYAIFSDGRNGACGNISYLRRDQLKSKLRIKLGLLCPNNLIDSIFKALDPHNKGVIQTRQFVMLFVNSHTWNAQTSILSVPERNEDGQVKSQEEKPYVTYDGKFKHLAPPPALNSEHNREPYKPEHLEQAIYDHVIQRKGSGATLLQTLVKCFGDSRGDKRESNVGITRDQVKYSLWTKFQMRVTEDEIDLLFKKYDKNNEGLLPLHPFVQGIIKNHSTSKVLMEEGKEAYADDPQHRKDVDWLLSIIKSCISRAVSRESRAPHYILHSSTRMRLDQFKAFISQKLQVPMEDHDTVIKLATTHYSKDSLIEVRKMLYDAMSFKGHDDHSGLSVEQRKNRVITATELPYALKETKYTPEKIQDMLILKIQERFANNHPLSTLHKLFKDGHNATRTIDKGKIRSLFARFDMLIPEEDFDSFFKSHDRGDGLIDVRSFLMKLTPQPDYEINPLSPKSPAAIVAELKLANKLASLTGRKREISSINGISSIPFEKIDTDLSTQDIGDNKIDEYEEYVAPPPIKVDNFFGSLRQEDEQSRSDDPFDHVMEGRPYSTPLGSNAGHESSSASWTDGSFERLSSYNGNETNEFNPNVTTQPSYMNGTITVSSPMSYGTDTVAVSNTDTNRSWPRATASARPSSAGVIYAPSPPSSSPSSVLSPHNARRCNVFEASPPKAPSSDRPKTVPSPRARLHHPVGDNSPVRDNERPSDKDNSDPGKKTQTAEDCGLPTEELDEAIKLYKDKQKLLTENADGKSVRARRRPSTKTVVKRQNIRTSRGNGDTNMSDLVVEGAETLTSTSPRNQLYPTRKSNDSRKISLKLLTSGTQPNSPRRPGSAPSQRFANSMKDSPRYNTRAHLDSGSSKNPFALGSGRINAYNNVLMCRYKVASRNTVTNHEQYGLFIKSLQQVLSYQKRHPGTTGFVRSLGSRPNTAR